MDEEVAREEADADFERKKKEQRKRDDEKTEKNRKRREKNKARKGNKEDREIDEKPLDLMRHGETGVKLKVDRRPLPEQYSELEDPEEIGLLANTEEVGVIIHDDD